MYSSTGVGKLAITGGEKFKFTCGDEVMQYNVQRSGSVAIIHVCIMNVNTIRYAFNSNKNLPIHSHAIAAYRWTTVN